MGTYETIGGYPADNPEMLKDGFEACCELLNELGWLEEYDPHEFEDCGDCPLVATCPMLEQYQKEESERTNPPNGKE